MSKEIIVVVDMQNDFIDGALSNKTAEDIIPQMVDYLEDKRKDGAIITFTRDTHFDSYLDSIEGKHLPVKHCIEGTKGWEIHKDLQPFVTDDNVVDKTHFGFPELPAFLENQVKLHDKGASLEDYEITLVGTCTSICVVSNALVLKANVESEINVVESLTACLNEDTQKSAIDVMRTCHVNIL